MFATFSPQSGPATRFPSLDSKQHAAVNSKTLLALYLIIPLCGLLVMADMLLLENRLFYQYLPTSPEAWMVWAIVFETPHIVASFFSFGDREYIRYYGKRLLSGLSIIVASVLFVLVIAPAVLPASLSDILRGLLSSVFVIYTMYHVLSQQFGVAMALMRLRPDHRYELLRWGATLSGTIMYTLAMVDKEMVIMGVSFGVILQWSCAGMIALTCLAGWNISKLTSERKGKLFLYTNLAMLVCVYAFLYLDYSIFVLMIPRFVHDLTAFYVYGVHDHNRNREKNHNILYRPFYAISPLVICPVLALVLGNLLESGNAAIPAFLMVVTFLHYHVEGFIWKGNSLHRQFVSFR